MISIAVLSFPGMNCEMETLRALRRNSFQASIVRWNADQEQRAFDAYILPGGFSYEDRARAGMVAARHPLLSFLKKEAAGGKTIIGICNGAQILVESGLIPLGDGLQMALAKNHVLGSRFQVSGFRNEWVWIRRTCQRGRCAGSDWDGALHLPIAHGEGRWTTRDPDVLKELEEQDLVAFRYCDAQGNASDAFPVNPNGSLFGIAGICNPTGNIVGLMPHPERTPNGDLFFQSLHRWLTTSTNAQCHPELVEGRHSMPCMVAPHPCPLPVGEGIPCAKIFIDTVITNNEERTIEATLRKIHPHISLKQFQYIALREGNPHDVLCNVMFFNPHRDIAYVRSGGQWFHWKSATQSLEPLDATERFAGTMFLRRDDEEKKKSEGQHMTGTCYLCRNIDEQQLYSKEVLEVLANPHASTLEKIPSPPSGGEG